MGLRASDLPEAVQQALAKQLERERGVVVPPRELWLARCPMLSAKPIKTTDPELFLKLVRELQARFPTTNIYIFRIELRNALS